MRVLGVVLLAVLLGAWGPKGGAIPGVIAPPSLDSLISGTIPTLWIDPEQKVIKDASDNFSSICSRPGAICFTQGTGAAMPTTATTNGKTVMALNGTAQFLSSASLGSAIFGASAKSFIVAGRAAMTTSDDILATGADQFQLQFSASGFNFRNNDGAGDNNIIAFTANTPFVIAGWHDGVNTSLRVNGGAVQQVASGATASLANPLYIGQFGTSVNWYDGQIYQIITWDKVLSDGVLKEIERGLAKKFGVTGYTQY